jgi:hypothetical protein
MAVFWVQQWVALPIIVEGHMGDVPHDLGSSPPRHGSQEPKQDDPQFLGQAPSVPSGSLPVTSRSPGAGAPFYSQYSNLPGQPQRVASSSSLQLGNRYGGGAGQNQIPHGFNMSAMAGALPDYGMHTMNNMQTQAQQPSTQTMSGASTPAVVYQIQQNLQYPPQGSATYMNPAQYGGYVPSQFPGYHQPHNPQSATYAQYGPGQHRMGADPQQFAPYPQVAQQYYYYPGAVGGHGQQPSGFSMQTATYPAPYSVRPGSGGSHNFGAQGGSLGPGPISTDGSNSM